MSAVCGRRAARAARLLVVVVALLAGCAGESPVSEPTPTPPTAPTATTDEATEVALSPAPSPTNPPPPTQEVTATPAPLPAGVTAAPDWLGTRVLPTRPDGFGEVQPTPPELVDRRFTTEDVLPPPPDDTFSADVGAVPDDVLTRSTWSPDCPVSREDLAYVTVSFWGFDERTHTGELLVHTSAAVDLVEVFRRLHEARFPIEEMRVVRPDEVDAPPTGDGNNTTAFVCRPSTGATSWSQHAYGLAIDVNPFHNPYLKGDVVLPELASAYLDRDDDRPGMIHPGDVVTQTFADIGWRWGGAWDSLRDWMHFSSNGR